MPKLKKVKESDNEELLENKLIGVSGTKTLDAAIKMLKKKHGEDVVNWLSESQIGPLEVISTGSLGLDSALGVGGVARGRIYELFGPHSSGKSTLAYSIIVNARKQGLKALYVDAEHTLDKRFVEKIGGDPENIILVRGYTGEDNLDIAETLIETGEIAVCVIDSISALQPQAEANLDSFSNNTMGLHPRLMSRMCRTFTPLVSRTKTTLLLINQIRSNVGGYGPANTTSGGNAIQHHISGKIYVTGGGVKSKLIKNEKGDAVGHRVSFEIQKNKLAPPYRTAEADLIYGIGFDTVGEVVDLGVEMGFIDLNGSWYSYNGEKMAQGRLGMVKKLNDSKDLYEELRGKVSSLLGISKGKGE